MSTPAPAPLLRPSVNSPRNNGPRPPRLGLSIPNSPHSTGGRPNARAPPQLKLATPGNTNGLMGPPENRRTGSISGPVPSSASSQYSALSFAMGLRNQVRGSPDASNAGGGSSGDDSDRKSALEDQDYDNLDVEELPVEGWKRARETGRIAELGDLGEGAGGAVTRCILKGGKTVFALKVCPPLSVPDMQLTAVHCFQDHHRGPHSGGQKADFPGAQFQSRVLITIHLQILRSIPGHNIRHNINCDGIL
jgi:mitogen-activated protein kinase kinase